MDPPQRTRGLFLDQRRYPHGAFQILDQPLDGLRWERFHRLQPLVRVDDEPEQGRALFDHLTNYRGPRRPRDAGHLSEYVVVGWVEVCPHRG